MDIFEEHRWQASRALSVEQVAYLRTILISHGVDSATGTCRICRVSSCPDWRYAYDQLAVAGQLMAEHETWSHHGRTSPAG